jgi:adenylate cyclase
MLRVPEASAAVELAVRVISEVGSRHGALAVRVGAHSGSAVERSGDWYGAAVNLAARVTEVADRGQLLMTDATYDAARAVADRFRLERRQPQSFKHVSEPVLLYALTLAAQAETSSLPVDPVCHMAVEPARAAERRTYHGRELHFCSEACVSVFDRHPERYISEADLR